MVEWAAGSDAANMPKVQLQSAMHPCATDGWLIR